MGAEVHPHWISRAGGLRRRVHRVGLRQMDGVVVSMSAPAIFGTGFSLGVFVATALLTLFWCKGDDVETSRCIWFLFGVAVAGLVAGVASADSEKGW